ncbi:hypothetical protein AR687_21470 [Flavobacteriaceae bacterium CRH]|nr:hypothetical protein AR687_21470 [Flavobacteriaceae bacterium CRH]
MEENRTNSKGFPHIIQASFLAIVILIVLCISIPYLRYAALFFNLAMNSFLFAVFFLLLSLTSLLFSTIFYYLNKAIPSILYLFVFFFGLWATLFLTSNFSDKKSMNQIPDIMDGVSETITAFLIGIVFIYLISNYIITAKTWYIKRKNIDSTSKF